jgi:hypothetical protein
MIAATTAGENELRRKRKWVEAGGLAVLALAAALWFHLTVAQPRVAFFYAQPGGYYSLQTAGFARGQLNVAITPPAALLALKDPYDPVANAPYRAHDMTLWRGKYYLYFGVTPVLVFFWPLYALTGWYPTEGLAVAMFCSAGVAISLALLGAVRWRYFPRAGALWLVAGALVLVLANPVALLVQAPQFYQVPISAAFALHMGMLGAIYGAVNAGRRRAWAWLAVASGLYGLSIAARPNYVLSGFALAVPWVVLVGRSRTRGWFWPAVKLGLAAFGPAVAAGLGLLIYNWLRFGNPTEFGMKFTLGGEKFPDRKLMGLEFVWPHVHDYLTRAGNWGRYFPFFSIPSGIPYGALRYGPWLWFMPAALLAIRPGTGRGGAAVIVAVGVAAVANLALLCVFFGLTDRYPPDYVPAALLFAGIGALALGQRRGEGRWAWTRGAGLKVVGAGLAGLTIFFALAVWTKHISNQALLLPVARMANRPTDWWERWRGETPGGLCLELELPVGKPGRIEPLVHTGVSHDARDWLQIEYLSGNRAQLGWFHAGQGVMAGREFAIPTGRKITVELECGALVPPFAHPMFEGWTFREWTEASRRVRVRVDGNEVLAAVVGSYESTAEDVRIGRMALASGSVADAFTGQIVSVAQFPVRKPPAVVRGELGRAPLELTLRLPSDRADGREPLVTTGNVTRFDVLYCRYAGTGRVVFGLYHHGYEPAESEELPYDALASHSVRVWMGSLADVRDRVVDEGGSETVPYARRLVVIFDGKVALNQEQDFYPAAPRSVVLGENRGLGDITPTWFTGEIMAAQPVGFTTLPATEALRRNGMIDMVVEFPQAAQGTAEPLAVSGVAGAGDFIYVRYSEGGRLVFGFDHWGVGGITGKPVTVDLREPHRLRMTMGSLYPPEEKVGTGRTRVRVMLDETVVLEGEYECYPSTQSQVRIGMNPIGGSTCGPVFSGKIRR